MVCCPYRSKIIFRRGNIQAANAELAVAGLPEEDRRAYLDAQKLLKPFEISVFEALREYVNARERLIPYKKTLPECVTQFERWNTIKEESTILFNAYGLYMDDMQAKRKSVRRIEMSLSFLINLRIGLLFLYFGKNSNTKISESLSPWIADNTLLFSERT